VPVLQPALQAVALVSRNHVFSILPASAGSGAARLGVPGAVLLCRRPFVGAPGWGLQFSRAAATDSRQRAGQTGRRLARSRRTAAAAHENPASV